MLTQEQAADIFDRMSRHEYDHVVVMEAALGKGESEVPGQTS